jgi:hypothetical protein
MVWTQRRYTSWENPLHSEFLINGKTIDIFTSDTHKPIESYLKKGWTTITIKTTPEDSANRDNDLSFSIGPVHRDKNDHLRMAVIWKFRNGTDWKFKEGSYTHALGPQAKDVTLSHRVYYAGLDHEGRRLRTGDYIVTGKPEYGGWNAPVTATVFVNGTPLNSFLLEGRQVVITPLLKQGKNEIKLVASRVKNAVRQNDIAVSVAGPAEYSAAQERFLVKPIVEAKAMQGWQQDKRTGQWFSKADPDADTVERTIPFFLEEAPNPSDR